MCWGCVAQLPESMVWAEEKGLQTWKANVSCRLAGSTSLYRDAFFEKVLLKLTEHELYL